MKEKLKKLKDYLLKLIAIYAVLTVCLTTSVSAEYTVVDGQKRKVSVGLKCIKSSDTPESGVMDYDKLYITTLDGVDYSIRMLKIKDENELRTDLIGYCIEHGVSIPDENYNVQSVTNSSYWKNLPREVQKGITYATLYGYPTNNWGVKNCDAYAATQIIIWEFVAGYRTLSGRTNDSLYKEAIKGSPAEAYYNKLAQAITNHEKSPSFNQTSVTAEYNNVTKKWEATLTDSNGIISEYVRSDSNSAIKTSVSGNTLKISVDKMLSGQTSLAFKKSTVPSVTGQALVLMHHSEGQKVVSGRLSDPITFNLKLVTAPNTGNMELVKTSEDGKVDGIDFTITGNGVNKTVTTANGGKISVSDLLPGTYTVTEESIDHYVPQESKTVTIVSGETATVNFANHLKRASLTVTKTAEDGLVENIQFRLTGTSDAGIKVDEFATTNANGVAVFEDVLVGKNYLLSEVDTPSRYVIPEPQNVNVEWNVVNNASIENILKKWRADVFKVDGNLYYEIGGEGFQNSSSELNWPYGITQGNASLEGAVYGVYKNDELMDTYTTDKNGRFITKYYAVEDGNTWTIKEISPSEGYLLDPTVYPVYANNETYSVELNTEYMNVYEDIIQGKIAIIKHTDDGSTQIEHPEGNAVFEVFLKSAGSFENARETERALLTTDEYGFAKTEDFLPFGIYTVKQIKGAEGTALMPAFDVTINEDGKTYRYLINNATFAAEVEIVKKDKETNKVIPVAGIGFKVRNKDTGEYIVQHVSYPVPMDVEIYYTNNTGKLMLPYSLPYGNYEIIEQNTCDGYVLDSTPIPFKVDGSKELITVVKTNVAQKGTISILKKGEIFSSVTEKNGVYKPVYQLKGLQGAVFEVTAMEDIVTLDGTVRYTKGQVVDTITTGIDGVATTKLLYLGKYQCKEITAPHGTVLNKNPINVELIYAGENVTITATSTLFVNQRQKVVINLKKTLEQDDIFSIGNNGEIRNVKFGLFADEKITAADGKFIPKDGLLETAYCDANGNVIFATDLPVGAKVYVKELGTDKHYLLNNKKYTVVFDYAGQETKTVRITINGGEAIENKLIRGSILGKKIDEDGFSICGSLFGLFSADTTEFVEETAILTCQSNEIGVFLFENVPYGKYIIREIKAAPAYVLNENSFEVVIDEYNETIELVIENKFVIGSVQTIKVDKDYPENTLAGAVFEIYVDVNGNKIYDAEIDLLVGKMTEGEKGLYTMENLRYNGYFLYEKTAPLGFIKDDNYHYFEIRENGTVIIENEAGVGFINEAIKGSVKIVKKDADSGEALSDVEFALCSLDGKEVVRGITDEKGELVFENIRFGKYELKEITTKDGYLKNEEVISVEITENEQMFEFEITNKKVPTSPKTGDKSNTGLWITIMLVALAVVIGIGIYNRRTRR